MKKSAKGRYNFLLDTVVYEKFSKLCDEEGFVRGKKIEQLIKKFIEDYKK